MPVRSDITKIVCTMGPASANPDVIRKLMLAGMNVARLNFSHGTHEAHARTVATIRGIAQELGKPVAILGDLQGPRIRIGLLKEPRQLVEGDSLVLAPEAVATGDEIPVTYDDIAKDVQKGGTILVDDGLLSMQVTGIDGVRVAAKVRYGGLLKSNKGMNLPGIDVSAPSLTEKDRADIPFAIEQDLDYLALSFVRRPEDIEELRALLPKGMLIVAKIEKDSALDRIEEILKVTDAVMVARGDLGVELPFEEVPLQQKRIIGLAARYGRPVITATQMLESMIQNPRPTRAEASDVANAILDGTDAVMLSAETAAGLHPVLAVEAMRRIASTAITGCRPAAVSAESIRASVPSRIAFATSLASARVGRGFWIIDSSICVAVITGRPSCPARRMIRFCTSGTSSKGSSTPRSPRATITASAERRISSMYVRAVSFSIFATISMPRGIIERSCAMSAARRTKLRAM